MTKKIILTAVAIVLFLVACFSGYKVISTLLTRSREQSAFDKLSEIAESATQAQPDHDKTDTETEPETDAVPEYSELYALNNDFFGWLCIDGTKINYPVMHTPADPEYYIHRAFDRSSSENGCLFMDGACRTGCGNYLIYGHHMKTGTMFGTLDKFSKKEYWQEHKSLHLNTLEEFGEYEILGAFYSRLYYEGEEGFRYYSYTDLTDRSVFDEYVKLVKRSSLYDTGITAEYGDTLVTLSTCSYHVDDGRFVVVARKKAA